MALRNRFSKWLSAILLTAAVHFLTAAPAAAQCVMCYLSANGSGNRGIRSIQIGILILMIPTVAFMAGLVYVVIRRRHGARVGTEKPEKDLAWDEGLADLEDLRIPPGTEGLSPRA